MAISKKSPATELQLRPKNQNRLAILCGQFGEHIKQIEKSLQISIHYRSHDFFFTGSLDNCELAKQLIQQLYMETAEIQYLTPEHIKLSLQQMVALKNSETEDAGICVFTPNGMVKPLNPHQEQYLKNMLQYDINFGIGPAGTGKTFLAVAAAVNALERMQYKRIILTRPVIEAGEHLGFLPGTLVEKVDPYFRPIYDSLYELLGVEKALKLIERQIIEVAPLAYMRGRTLNDAFIILDEAQNTTREQMKMFLTRTGFGSKAVITGDITQTDLPIGKKSGLNHALTILNNVSQISFTYFQREDIVRHPLIQAIIEAYENEDKPRP